MNDNKTVKPIPEEKDVLHMNLGFAGIEAYKLIRANLTFMLPSDEDRRCKFIGITSSVRSEGKSTTAINLAYVIAEAGNKVLLVDGDMRLPSVGKKLKISNTPGLSNALSQLSSGVVEIHKDFVFENWDVLTAGDIPPNPSELLGSGRFKRFLSQIADLYDYCIVDLPPVNIVADALVVSSVLDGMIVVVREDYTERSDLNECMRKLNTVHAKVIGMVVNYSGTEDTKYKYYKNRHGYYKKKNSKRYGYDSGYGYGYGYGYEKAAVSKDAKPEDNKTK